MPQFSPITAHHGETNVEYFRRRANGYVALPRADGEYDAVHFTDVACGSDGRLRVNLCWETASAGSIPLIYIELDSGTARSPANTQYIISWLRLRVEAERRERFPAGRVAVIWWHVDYPLADAIGRNDIGVGWYASVSHLDSRRPNDIARVIYGPCASMRAINSMTPLRTDGLITQRVEMPLFMSDTFRECVRDFATCGHIRRWPTE